MNEQKSFQILGQIFLLGFQNCLLRVRWNMLTKNTFFWKNYEFFSVLDVERNIGFCQSFFWQFCHFCFLRDHRDIFRNSLCLLRVHWNIFRKQVFFGKLLLLYSIFGHRKKIGWPWKISERGGGVVKFAFYLTIGTISKFIFVYCKKKFSFYYSWPLEGSFRQSGKDNSVSFAILHSACS